MSLKKKTKKVILQEKREQSTESHKYEQKQSEQKQNREKINKLKKEKKEKEKTNIGKRGLWVVKSGSGVFRSF